MKTIPLLLTSLLILTASMNLRTREREVVEYKQIDTVSLKLEILYPEQMEEGNTYPALVFFFGGGWNGGNRYHFENHAAYFARRGLVCILADYRIRSVHGTTPFESLKDARSAMRYIRKHADRFGVDPSRIIASGGSAGGHLAAATALVDGFDEEGEDHSTSCKPQALVLFNPVIDNSPGGYGHERIGEKYRYFSPLHNLSEGTPPTIFFLGTADRLIPVETGEYYQAMMERLGSRCDLHLYEGAGHGFFNYRNFDYYKNTLIKTDSFLVSLGYLGEEPVVEVE